MIKRYTGVLTMALMSGVVKALADRPPEVADKLNFDPGPSVVLVSSMLGIFAVVGIAGLYWAYRHGQFKEVEEAKYRMLDVETRYPVKKTGR